MLVVERAVLLTMGPAGVVEGWMTVGDDGRIAGVGEGAPPPLPPGVGRIDAGGALVAPGFVSAHSHLHTSAARGLGTESSLYGWIEAMTTWIRRASPEDMYWATLHGALDFLGNGITTAYDFTNGRLDFDAASAGRGGYGGELRPAAHVERQLDGKLDAGIRFVHSVMLDDAAGTPEEVAGRFEEAVDHAGRHRERPELLGLAISGGVQWARERSTAALEVELMQRHGVCNQAHFLETAEQLELQRSKFSWYEEAGAFGPRFLFGHFIHPTPDQMARAAASGSAMVWQPTSNGRLGSGVADIPRLRALGMPIGVGLDDQSCTDVSDPFQNLRIGLYTQRAAHEDPTAVAVGEMLELHTIGSARVLGVDDRVGSLEPGKWADFLVVDPTSPDTGPMWDPVATYVLACSLRNLKQVYVAGRLVSEEGVAVSIDGDGVSAEVHERFARLSGRPSRWRRPGGSGRASFVGGGRLAEPGVGSRP